MGSSLSGAVKLWSTISDCRHRRFGFSVGRAYLSHSLTTSNMVLVMVWLINRACFFDEGKRDAWATRPTCQGANTTNFDASTNRRGGDAFLGTCNWRAPRSNT